MAQFDDETDRRRAALQAVVDPVLFHSLGELGTLREVRPRGRALEVVVAVPTDAYPEEAVLRERLASAAGADVDVVFESMGEDERVALGLRLRDFDGTSAPPSGPAQGHGGTARPNPFGQRRGGTRILAISSGKGGVGKSSVTVNLAVSLAAAGHSVGLLDADIYGFSAPRMLGVERPPMTVGRTLVPPVAHGVRVVSMGFFVDEDKAVAWRGPMLHKALEQFLVDVHWGAPEFLVVDLPPGTGDVPLSIAQQLPGAECYVVTTPQPAAQRVAQRSAALARQLRLPLRGVIENMSYWRAPDGTAYEIFGSGGGQELAEQLEVPLLARIPLETVVREGADDGRPASIAAPGGEVAAAFSALAERVEALGPARVYRSELKIG
ncbi:MAG: Iron-sulfur cluster carrier protein [Acidimicrobiaceae bacterium]|nr:Iron-sulfur cluster carrier protein [Acidimicrobiaceae bacterium]